MVKDAYYFPHDSNARNDPKIQALMSKYGYQGYGWYWAIIEILREQPEYKYPINKYTFDTFARIFQCDRNTTVEFINDCCHEFATEKSALLCMDEKNLWSESLIKRMKPIDERREKARESVYKRWNKYERNTFVEATKNDGNTSKVKESKVKESKVNSKNNIGALISEFTSNEELKTTINDFISMRNKIKKPMTERAVKMMLKKLNELSSNIETQIAILDQSITHCWQDIYPLKQDRPPDKPKSSNPFFDMLREEGKL